MQRNEGSAEAKKPGRRKTVFRPLPGADGGADFDATFSADGGAVFGAAGSSRISIDEQTRLPNSGACFPSGGRASEEYGGERQHRGAHDEPGNYHDRRNRFQDVPAGDPFIAVQQSGAGAGGRSEEGQMHAHDHHDHHDHRWNRIGAVVGAVAENDGHEHGAHGAVVDELAEAEGERAHADHEEHGGSRSRRRAGAGS